METFLRLLEPRSPAATVTQFLVFVGLVGASNFAFAYFYYGRLTHDPAYYIAHAIFVGGPFAAFSILIMMLQVRLQRKLSKLSQMDGLTGLNNRRAFFELIERHRKAKNTGVLLLIDADNFKDINDTYGHQTGDKCLKSISRELAANTRKGDVIGRIGGEEFAVFLNSASRDQARQICDRLTQPILCNGGANQRQHIVTLSVGAVCIEEEESLDSLFANADQALYRAKEQGRARMVMWEDMQTLHEAPLLTKH